MSKFFGVNSDYVYSKTYKGATKVGGKIKFGGAENVANQFVIDAIDIDWGGLSLTSIYDSGNTSGGTKNIELHKIDSNDENQNGSEEGIGISSTGYALAKLSDSFTYIVDVIGTTDTATGTVRKRVADLETSVKALSGGNTSSINDVVNKINRIEQELEENPNVNNWVTWVDSLKKFNKGTDVKKYIDDADNSLSGRINSKADVSTVGQISGRVGTLETTVGADDEHGLRKDVVGLKNTVGDASSGLVKNVADLNTNKADKSAVNTNTANLTNLQNIVGTNDSQGLRKKIADLTANKADKDTVSGISTKVTNLQNTVGNSSSGLVKDVADLKANKASASTVSLLLNEVYPNGNTGKTSYIQTYALPAYNIAWENKTAIENLKTSGISATRIVDADGNGILVFKSLSTN